jgi:hypothetical protein
MKPAACTATAKLTDVTSKRHNSANLFVFRIFLSPFFGNLLIR